MSTTQAGEEKNAGDLGFKAPAIREQATSVAEAEAQRAVAEIQAMMVIAQKFPRNEAEAVARILNAFSRPELCEKAMYEYPRGNETVSGLSIRAAEALIQQWGHTKFGIEEIERRVGSSMVRAYAWDLQNNVIEERKFHVEHVREAKRNGVKTSIRLEDSRDVYELTANQGARRLRACILGILPIDVQRAAEEQIETTLRGRADITPERIQSLFEMFAEEGVSRRQIENLLKRPAESITPIQMLRLGRIYNALHDGIGSVGDYFEVETPAPTEGEVKDRAGELAERIEKKKNKGEKVGDPAPTATSEVEKETPPQLFVTSEKCELCGVEKGKPHDNRCPAPAETA